MSYFDWLCGLVCADSNHIGLLRILDSYIYIWYLILDENRAKGGYDLRRRYAEEVGITKEDVRTTRCTVLEMLIALSELMSDQIDDKEPYECFWMIINNFGYDGMSPDEVGDSIECFQSNHYSTRYGGPFPLKYYHGDVRALDLYSQMNAWIEENFPHQNIF